MNPELVFCRTPEGERLARTPRQIASYANRATLLLLDGTIPVGELLRRFGETLPIEEALAELERDGLVYSRVGAGEAPTADALPVEEGPLDFGHDPLFDPGLENISEAGLVEGGAASEGVLLAGRDDLREPTPVLDAPTQFEEHFAVLEAEPAEPVVASPIAAPDLEDEEPPPVAEKRGFARPEGLGRKLKVFGLVACAAALLAGVGLWLSDLRPRIEARATAALGVPVSVGAIGVSVQHGPALALKRVGVGLAAPLVLPGVEVIPNPLNGNVWSASHVRVVGASLKPSELAALIGLVGKSEAGVDLTFSDLALRLGEKQVGGLTGGLARTPDGQPVLKLADPAGGLSLELRPDSQGLRVILAASPGSLPLLGGPKMGTVELRGLLGDDGLTGGELGMTGYGGKFDGTLAMAWQGAVSVEAKLRFVSVSMNQLSRSLFERGGFSEGLANGTLNLRARAARWEELTRIDDLTSSFVIERGALKGFDLGSALRERSPRPISGGETRFESLRGRLDADPREIRLAVDRLDSGALTAVGQLTVDSFQSLRGSLNASVQVPGRGALQYPALVEGSVALPTIQLRLPAAIPTGPQPGGAVR